ncbi:alpha/beta hydrolase family protein [Allorhodopirellula solitaria]|uniref:Prolyl oligopeptidase family protein n=1 Tax=Allorhodopirellula solitaria TaxID=2527987 RepID=A0A5C5XSE6_9BACT|nr:prolyl oligopeptidase family serine peptidase [Allorhodopirellula solitaria]TWT64965.1 Prolyl oligopeptidase family protein [Allorhodopirellula solitaria]
MLVWLPAYHRFPALEIDQESAAADSPLLHVTADDAPTLLLAGVQDELVPISHSRNIQAALEEAGVANQLIEFKDAGHGFTGQDAQRAIAATVDWFEQHIGKPAP